MMKPLFIMLLVSGVVLELHAELLVGTPTNAPVTSRVAIGEYALGGSYPVLQARSFVTGSTGFWLESIDFGSHLYVDAGSGTLSISLHSNNGSVPGSVLLGGQDLFTADSSTVGQPIQSSSPLLLEANSSYWFVLSADQSSGDTRYWWNVTDSAIFNSEVPGADLHHAFASSAGGTWDRQDGLSPMIEVHGSSVPEPGTISLLGLGAAGTLLARRKRMQRGGGIGRPQFEEISYVRPFLEEESGNRTLDDPFA